MTSESKPEWDHIAPFDFLNIEMMHYHFFFIWENMVADGDKKSGKGWMRYGQDIWSPLISKKVSPVSGFKEKTKWGSVNSALEWSVVWNLAGLEFNPLQALIGLLVVKKKQISVALCFKSFELKLFDVYYNNFSTITSVHTQCWIV